MLSMANSGEQKLDSWQSADLKGAKAYLEFSFDRCQCTHWIEGPACTRTLLCHKIVASTRGKVKRKILGENIGKWKEE